MADRVRPTSLAKVCALAAACTMVPQMLAQSFLPLMIGRMAMAFFAGGLGPVLTTWLSRVTPPERRGSIFGWCASARSLGWGIAPYFSARVGSTLGPRYSFFGACVSYVLLILLISFVANRVAHPVTDGIIEKISPS
jgi:DHA1 family multidrug resistance protein-like MFS transporter